MQAFIDARKSGRLNANPCVVISNNSDSMALHRAKNEGNPSPHISSLTHPGPQEGEEILRVFKRHGVDTVILAGCMKRLGTVTLRAYEGRNLNIHPTLLPRLGGKGMYGKRVHGAVLAAGE
jgi:phosphoribosylglycinamide formyltransferase-1